MTYIRSEISRKDLRFKLEHDKVIGGSEGGSDSNKIEQIKILRNSTTSPTSYILKFGDIEINFNNLAAGTNDVMQCAASDDAKFTSFYEAVKDKLLPAFIYNTPESDASATYDTKCRSTVQYNLCSNFISISYYIYDFNSGGYTKSVSVVLRQSHS